MPRRRVLLPPEQAAPAVDDADTGLAGPAGRCRPGSAPALAEIDPPVADRTAGLQAAARPTLTLYLRAGCHLCEDLESTLLELVDPAGFVLQRVDIDSDPALRERFHTAVPVLMHGEQELCRHFLDLEAVQLLLSGYNTAI